jgi:tetratricopeptide (TPR) repeat protein
MTAPSLHEIAEQAATAVSENNYWRAVDLYTRLLEQIAPHNTAAGLRDLRLHALRERGQLLVRLGELEASLAAYEQYLRESPTAEHRIEALVRIGGQLRLLGRFGQALDTLNQALQLANEVGYAIGQAQALTGKGATYNMIGRTDEAINHFRQAYQLYEESSDIDSQAQTLNSIGIAYGYTGQLDKAIAAFQEMLALSQHAPSQQHRLVVAMNNLGECYQHLFDMAQAIPYHEDALELAQKSGLRAVEVDICRNLGLELSQVGREEEGLAYLQQALKLSEEIHAHHMLAYTLYALVLTEVQWGNIEAAHAYAQRLHETAVSSDSRNELANAYHALGLVAQKQGDIDAAQELWHQATFLAHETNQRLLLWQIHAGLAEMAANPGLAAVHNRIAAEVIQQIAEPIEDEALRQRFLNAPPVQKVLAQQRS